MKKQRSQLSKQRNETINKYKSFSIVSDVDVEELIF